MICGKAWGAARTHNYVLLRYGLHVDVLDLGGGVIEREEAGRGGRVAFGGVTLMGWAEQNQAAAARWGNFDDPDAVVEDLGKEIWGEYL